MRRKHVYTRVPKFAHIIFRLISSCRISMEKTCKICSHIIVSRGLMCVRNTKIESHNETTNYIRDNRPSYRGTIVQVVVREHAHILQHFKCKPYHGI